MTLAVLAVMAVGFSALPASAGGFRFGPSWTMGGQNIQNWRFQPAEFKLNTTSVKKTQLKWVTDMAGDVSATPAVRDGFVYVPDWGGKFSKLNAATGAVVWSVDVTTVLGTPFQTLSRNDPMIDGNLVVFGSQSGAYLAALDINSGALVWKTQLDPHPAAWITSSPSVFNGVAYVGVSSIEELSALDPNYKCCTFRGSANAVRLSDGQRLWKTFTVPSNNGGADMNLPGGYAGAPIWSSTPTIDLARRSVYFTTGNNYAVPASVAACQKADPKSTTCDDPTNYVDSILSLDLESGRIKWANKLGNVDSFNLACLFGPAGSGNCPDPEGLDKDFGNGAMLIPTIRGEILAAGQKDGIMWGLNPNNGSIVWATNGGPGGKLGGMEWGSATDLRRIYYQITNQDGVSYTLTNPPAGTPAVTTRGLWGAMDPATGKILWQKADPNNAMDLGPVSVANGVLYASSMGGQPNQPGTSAGKPTMFALDASNGNELWSFVSGGSVNAGPAIVDGSLYWGSGYQHLTGDPNAKMFAFQAPVCDPFMFGSCL